MTAITKSRLHFVGIGGIGMSGIAEVFLNEGHEISGSDLAESEATRRLARLGAQVHVGHRAENVGASSVVVVSSAVKSDNPEVLEARRRRIPVVPRAEMLGELMRGRTGIAVAGTHGKTTTTSMLATALMVAGLDPTLVIGGRVDSLGGNAKLGHGQLLVAEADESDGSFLYLPATYGIITNIDNDHLDYFKSLGAIDEAFVSFVAKLPFYGCVAVCAEDPGVQRVMAKFSKPFVTYGWTEACDLFASELMTTASGTTFVASARGEGGLPSKVLGLITLHVPGKHNVLNALAALAIGLKLGVPFAALARGLSEFKGVKRRFEVRYRDDASKRLIVDDYGHHPTEIVATLAAARSTWGKGRIVVIFQPHRYSRTLHCRDGFLSCFREADVVLVTDIYAAGEDPIDGVSGKALVDQMRSVSSKDQEIVHVGSLEGAETAVRERWKDGDLILCMGAGSITRLPDRLTSSP